MNIKFFLSVLLLFITFNIFSQDNLYSALTIPKELKENANATIRRHDIIIELHSYASMTVKSKRIITIFNKNGLNHLNPYVAYDPSIKVKLVSAKVYNAFGKEIKKFKKKDFKDYSNSGSELFSDDRYLLLDFTPTKYPFTFEFDEETETTNTAFLNRWYPLEGYLISTENSTFKIINSQSVNLNVNESNLEIEGITNNSEGNNIHYSAKNLKAYKREFMSPAFNKVMPIVKIAPEKFRLINVDGNARNWNDFGKWNYEKLLKNRNIIPASTAEEINTLVKGIKEPIEKAKLIYQYVQDKTRYISVQIGVGGWQPILASKVDEVSYGDCKALTNYTKALLESQGIESYYALVVRDYDLESIDSDFIAMQGNHAFLKVPNGEESVWLECTSQKVPFGHIANSTDDRDVFVITPEGGHIEHTKVYASQDSYLKSMASIVIDEQGGFVANFEAKSGGVQYSDRLDRIIDKDEKDKDLYYKKYWRYINDLSITKMELLNDKNNIEITENISIATPNYGVVAGSKLLIAPNFFNKHTSVPPRYSDRKLPFVIQRGFYDEDNYEINLPKGYVIEMLFENKVLETKFGVYKISLEKISDSKIEYKRTFEMFKGDYKKEDYNAYRSFIRKIAKADKASIVLNKIN